MIDRVEQDRLLALLAWWRAAGVDVATTETAIDWTARPDRAPGDSFVWPGREDGEETPSRPSPAQTPPPRASSAPRPPPPASPPSATRAFATAPPDAAMMAAREAARQAPTLEALEAALRRFDGCSLKATAKNLCFYRGSPQARLMLIGEAPGREEDLEGKPFVGRSGQLLDRMLAAIGLTEKDVHITNTVYWRPPGNRTPTLQETLVCRPFLERQIALVAPEVIVTLGGPAAKAVLGVDDGILRIRGRWRELDVDGRKIRVMPTLHPAYLLRTPAAKRQAWRDLLQVKAALGLASGDKTS